MEVSSCWSANTRVSIRWIPLKNVAYKFSLRFQQSLRVFWSVLLILLNTSVKVDEI